MITSLFIGLNIVEFQKPPAPEVTPFQVYVDNVIQKENNTISFLEVGEIKTIKLLRYGATYFYGGRVELDTNTTSFIKITDKSEEQFNTLLELELLDNTYNNLYIKFVDLAENYTFKINIKTGIPEEVNLDVPDLIFIN